MLEFMKTFFTTALLLLLSLALPLQVAAQVYKWTDELGRTHFTDSPPEGAKSKQIEISPLNTYNSPSQDAINQTLSRPTGVTKPSTRVIVYSTTWCGVCKKAKRWLRQNNISFREYDVEKSERGRRDYKKMNGRGVPIIKIGKKVFKGFRPSRMTTALRKAGYKL